jgi:S1-C subfamily serine protease
MRRGRRGGRCGRGGGPGPMRLRPRAAVTRATAGSLAALAALAALAGGCGGSDAPPRPPQVLRVTVAAGGLVPEVATGVAAGDGRVLTVAHALAGRGAVRVAGRPARVLRSDDRLDLALLAVPGLRAPAVRLGGDARRVTLAVLRHGRTRALGGAVRRRVVVRFRDQPSDAPKVRPGLELAASIDPGDSGAPVLDPRGRVLGVVYARSRDRADTAWAVDASAVRTLLAR